MISQYYQHTNNIKYDIITYFYKRFQVFNSEFRLIYIVYVFICINIYYI